MKILTINVIGIPSGTSDDLIRANVFQDYDVLVVNPEHLEGLYYRVEYTHHTQGILKSEYGQLVDSINCRRRKEVKGLLRRGGVIICFLQPLRSYSYYPTYPDREPGEIITNYDWLLEPLERERQLGTIKYSKGNSIELVDSNHPLAEYLKIKPSWSAYIDKDDCSEWKMLATAFDTHALALTKRIELGHIVFLPSCYDHHNGEVLEKCIIKLLKGKYISPQPDWAREILVPGQGRLITEINKLNKQIGSLENKRISTIAENKQLERWKYLLYEKGKHQLEPVVREAFSLIGYNVTPQADKDSDGVVTCGTNVALLEATGSKGTIRIEKLGELNTNIGNYISQTGKKVKGVLIGNPFCEEPLENRPPKDGQKPLFAKELIESAEQQGITVLLTTDLYDVVSQVLDNKMTSDGKMTITSRIFEGKGLVRLSSQ